MNKELEWIEVVEEKSQERMYESAVFGLCVRMGLSLSDEDKDSLRPLIQQANDRGVAPDRTAEIIASSVRG